MHCAAYGYSAIGCKAAQQCSGRTAAYCCSTMQGSAAAAVVEGCIKLEGIRRWRRSQAVKQAMPSRNATLSERQSNVCIAGSFALNCTWYKFELHMVQI